VLGEVEVHVDAATLEVRDPEVEHGAAAPGLGGLREQCDGLGQLVRRRRHVQQQQCKIEERVGFELGRPPQPHLCGLEIGSHPVSIHVCHPEFVLGSAEPSLGRGTEPLELFDRGRGRRDPRLHVGPMRLQEARNRIAIVGGLALPVGRQSAGDELQLQRLESLSQSTQLYRSPVMMSPSHPEKSHAVDVGMSLFCAECDHTVALQSLQLILFGKRQ